jgi:hypothetical protein
LQVGEDLFRGQKDVVAGQVRRQDPVILPQGPTIRAGLKQKHRNNLRRMMGPQAGRAAPPS